VDARVCKEFAWSVDAAGMGRLRKAVFDLYV
jgi:hypothetical protein